MVDVIDQIEIAKRSKVSQATVSRVLNNSSRVNEKTRNIVSQAVTELKYKPNAIAKALIQQKTKSIGVVVPDISTLFYPEIVESIEAGMRSNGYHVILAMSEDNPEEERACLEMLIEKRVDGVIIAPTRLGIDNGEYLMELMDNNVPLVFIDRYIGKLERDFVIIDNLAGALEAVNYLIKLGHTRIGYIAGCKGISASEDRLAGYKKALNEHGLKINENLIKESRDFKKESGYKIAKEFLKMKEMPTAIFTVNDMVAIGAMKALREEGLRVPEDISIVGFDDVELASYLDVPLTTVSQQQHEIGEISAKILIERIEKIGADKPMQIVLKPKLVIRESCSSPMMR